jgi:F-type H+-transporting ATPase subunit delta
MARAAVAVPYALALLQVASVDNSVAAVRDQVVRIAAAAETSWDLRNVFSNPTVTEDDRKKVIESLTQRLGLSRTVRNFLMILAEKRRLNVIGDIAAELQRLADEREGVLRAVAYTAIPLSPAQASTLEKTLSEQLGRRVAVRGVIDATVMGGVRVKIGDRVIDTSLRTQLDQLRQSILQSV